MLIHRQKAPEIRNIIRKKKQWIVNFFGRALNSSSMTWSPSKSAPITSFSSKLLSMGSKSKPSYYVGVSASSKF